MLKQVEETTGEKREELIPPYFPDECLSIWDAFINMVNVTYSEIKAYSKLTAHDLKPWEVDLIMDLSKMRSAKW